VAAPWIGIVIGLVLSLLLVDSNIEEEQVG
jgi:hypothetical protein